jgi:hypothetical protein
MDDKKRIILVGFAEALSAPEVIWNLLDAGFNVVAFTSRKHNNPLCNINSIDLVNVTPLRDNAEKTLSELGNIYKELKASAILPLNDSALWLCNKLSSDPEINVAGPTGIRAQFSLDKRIQIKAAQNAGFNVPETTIIDKIADTEAVMKFPVIVKSAMAVTEFAGRPIEKESMHYCKDKKEFNKSISTWNEKQPLLVQSIHKGIGEGLFGFAIDNDIILWTAHQRIRMMNPKGSGASACRAIPVIDHPLNCAKHMLTQIHWQGMFMIELLRDQNGKLWFIELNGRSWGSMALALRMGYDYPAWTVTQRLDPAFVPVQPKQKEYVICRNLGRELIHILQVLRGPSSKAIPNWPPFWSSFFDVLHIGKYDRWYNWRSGYTKFFLADTYNTLMNETIRKWIKT